MRRFDFSLNNVRPAFYTGLLVVELELISQPTVCLMSKVHDFFISFRQVTGVVGRAELLSAAFSLVAFLVYSNSIGRSGKTGNVYWARHLSYIHKCTFPTHAIFKCIIFLYTVYIDFMYVVYCVTYRLCDLFMMALLNFPELERTNSVCRWSLNKHGTIAGNFLGHEICRARHQSLDVRTMKSPELHWCRFAIFYSLFVCVLCI